MTWPVLFAEIAISMVGQTLLKARAQADIFLHNFSTDRHR
jgi:hypothetical protein